MQGCGVPKDNLGIWFHCDCVVALFAMWVSFGVIGIWSGVGLVVGPIEVLGCRIVFCSVGVVVGESW